MKVLKIVLALFALSAVVILHELGHATEMRERGIEVTKIALGFDLGFLPSFRFRSADGLEYIVSPIPFGGYVEYPKEAGEREKKFPLLDFMATSGGGIRANFIIAGLGVMICYLFRKHWKMEFPRKRLVFIVAVTALILTFARMTFYSILPVLELLVMILLFGVIIKMAKNFFRSKPKEPAKKDDGTTKATRETGETGNFGGFVSIIDHLWKIEGIGGWLLAISEISFGIGVFNLLPLGFLDGGLIAHRLIVEYMPKTVETAFNVGSRFGLMFIILLMLLGDIAVIRKMRPERRKNAE